MHLDEEQSKRSGSLFLSPQLSIFLFFISKSSSFSTLSENVSIQVGENPYSWLETNCALDEDWGVFSCIWLITFDSCHSAARSEPCCDRNHSSDQGIVTMAGSIWSHMLLSMHLPSSRAQFVFDGEWWFHLPRCWLFLPTAALYAVLLRTAYQKQYFSV